ncbi:MAG: DNA-protecting protein DprA [Candidatus Eremiobacter antarcticus]|nr:DNA-protecting protein DprA [Candidatus Eremiobacteraeota bacterium]MBC5808400.1 DNA-protecting protein DprA [Candidatus Eremiobacteraeota bacterium]PZR63762.1 MAG: DNA-protecting protein DprA [Candidatus Eremiobacter sp. RRmetagenome_bin22]
MRSDLEAGYLLAVCAAAVWTPAPLVAMLDALGSARKLVEHARDPYRKSADRTVGLRLGDDVLARIARVDDRAALDALREAHEADGSFVTRSCAGYPKRLLHLCDAPPVLYHRGSLQALENPTVAIVGSRAATHYGTSMASVLGSDFAAFRVTVISGLARGIDAAAHRGALAGGGRTVAVIGSGLQALYPPYHALLADEMVARGGAVVSEFPPRVAARPHQFPMRNRLVAALADATVVVEAGCKSGALITARLAAELGRPVFALPGDVGRPTSEGTNGLIKDGVTLTTGALDVHGLLNWPAIPMTDPSTRSPQRSAGAQESVALSDRRGSDALLSALTSGGSDVEELSALTGLDAATIAARLTVLEIQGLVERHPGGRFSAVKR